MGQKLTNYILSIQGSGSYISIQFIMFQIRNWFPFCTLFVVVAVAVAVAVGQKKKKFISKKKKTIEIEKKIEINEIKPQLGM